MRTRQHLVVIFVFFLSICTASAQITMTGGKGMLHLYEAETVTPGDLYVNPTASFYTRADYNENILLKDNAINVGLTLGISKVFETFVHLVPYQTDQVHLWGTPGDSKIGVKVHIPRPGVLQYGFLGYADIPTGKTHPIPFEPYSEDALGYAALGLLTLNFRNAEIPFSLKVSFNLGYKSHNSSNGFFAGKTDQLVGGFGCKFPIKSSQLYTEMSGEFFFNTPAVKFPQNSFRWSGGYKTFIKRGIIFDIAAELELGGYKPTADEQAHIPRFWENYADWKVIAGLTYRWTAFSSWDKERQLQEKQHELQEQESEEIKQQREEVIEELKEYQKRLEEEEKQNVPF